MVKTWMKNLSKLNLKLRKRVEFALGKILIGDLELLDIKRMEGSSNLFRCRVGDIRIIYYFNNKNIIIKNIDFRGRVYKGY